MARAYVASGIVAEALRLFGEWRKRRSMQALLYFSQHRVGASVTRVCVIINAGNGGVSAAKKKEHHERDAPFALK